MWVRGLSVLKVGVCCLPWLLCACQDGRNLEASLVDGAPPALCSQLRRDISRWQGTELADCGPDVSGLIELTALGNDLLLARKRFLPRDDIWSLSPDGAPGPTPVTVDQVTDASTVGVTVLPGSPPKVLTYDPRQSQWTLYSVPNPNTPGAGFGGAGQGQWPAGYWPPNLNGGPWNHQLIGLEDGNLLDRELGDGSTRIWRLVSSVAGTVPNQLVAPDGLNAGPDDHFRRGHRLVHLGPRRLLEWLPRPCASRAAPSDPCAGSDYNVWSYSLDGDGPLSFQLVSSGFWAEIGDESDILADGTHLFVWTRASGRLRSYAINLDAPDPLSEPPRADPAPRAQLSSQDWKPPTSAPPIAHLVVILQDGRSFDSYFGRYCQGTPGDGPAVADTSGATGCEAIPAAVPGADGCVDPQSDPSYRSVDAPECLRAKINNGSMDGFAIAHPPGPCGDPRDFACDDGAGGGTLYQGMVGAGALADRFFQTYAFVDGVAADAEPDPLVENLLYLVSARFSPFPVASLTDTPLLTKELARLQVTWAIYAGPVNLPQLRAFGVPIFYDPDWFPYRSLNSGELEHDIAVGALPAVSVILPDRGDPLRSEAPGQPTAPGIGYVQSLVSAIAASPYQDNTLVLVAHLTAGGFYDHVPPPPAPPLSVDASSGTAAQAAAVHYGPRVPLLALGKFARRNFVSHAQLEMSSITRFVEWNWLHGLSLKGGREPHDIRRYRDTVVNNLGSLIDGTAAQIEVPSAP